MTKDHLHTHDIFTYKIKYAKVYTGIRGVRGGGGGRRRATPKKCRIGVCHEGSYTLTLFSYVMPENLNTIPYPTAHTKIAHTNLPPPSDRNFLERKL